MKCHICGYEIPDNKKFCPGCGRVLTIEEQKKQAEQTKKNYSDNTIVYRPATTRKVSDYSSQTNIPDIFSNDPDAPEYNDPHIYDKATADILEYDRMFVSRKNNNKSSDTYASQEKKSNDDLERTMYFNIEQENNDAKPDDSEYSSEEDKSYDANTKPRLNINIKMLVVCIAIIAGIAIIITGTYQIGKKIGLWSTNESTSQESYEGQTLGEKAPVVDEPQSNIAVPESDYIIGIYTLTSEQSTVFVYKGATDDRIVATIPNGTVIEITEVKGEMGKTTYSSFTGWVRMEELTYSPNDKLTEKETTTVKETSSESDTTTNDDETTTAPVPSTPGTYTVDLKGDGTYVNVRDTSSTDGNVVATLDEGTQVTVDTVDGSWGHIKTSDGTQGWIYMVYLK